jgi:hypothetical protein
MDYSWAIRDLENYKKNLMFTFRTKSNYHQPSNVNNRITYFNRAMATCQNLHPGDRVLVLIWDDRKTGEVFPHLIVKKS